MILSQALWWVIFLIRMREIQTKIFNMLTSHRLFSFFVLTFCNLDEHAVADKGTSELRYTWCHSFKVEIHVESCTKMKITWCLLFGIWKWEISKYLLQKEGHIWWHVCLKIVSLSRCRSMTIGIGVEWDCAVRPSTPYRGTVQYCRNRMPNPQLWVTLQIGIGPIDSLVSRELELNKVCNIRCHISWQIQWSRCI
jgi:hypothetical protein